MTLILSFSLSLSLVVHLTKRPIIARIYPIERYATDATASRYGFVYYLSLGCRFVVTISSSSSSRRCRSRLLDMRLSEDLVDLVGLDLIGTHSLRGLELLLDTRLVLGQQCTALLSSNLRDEALQSAQTIDSDSDRERESNQSGRT
mgnify:CR=1 FL=1